MRGRVNYQEVYASDSSVWLLWLSTTLQILSFSPSVSHAGESFTDHGLRIRSFAFTSSLLPSESHAGERGLHIGSDSLHLPHPCCSQYLIQGRVCLWLIIYYRWSTAWIPPYAGKTSTSFLFRVSLSIQGERITNNLCIADSYLNTLPFYLYFRPHHVRTRYFRLTRAWYHLIRGNFSFPPVTHVSISMVCSGLHHLSRGRGSETTFA